MADNTTASLERPSCQFCIIWWVSGQIWTILWFEIDFSFLEVEIKVFKKDDNKDFRLLKNLTKGDTNFKQFK